MVIIEQEIFFPSSYTATYNDKGQIICVEKIPKLPPTRERENICVDRYGNG